MELTSRAFIWRRLHSFAGFWFALYIIMHLFDNSQAALAADGRDFINTVNGLQNLPYLPLIEILGLGVPIFIHALWGVAYIWTSKTNSLSSDGTTPALIQYPRNHAFTWQRLTSWILIVGIVAHVIHMRFWERPISEYSDGQSYYIVPVKSDPGLGTLASRLDITLYNIQDIESAKLKELKNRPINHNQVMAVAKNFGTADLLVVREVFKSPLMMLLYSIFVITASFHAFNGMWTFMITWGITLSQRAQRWMRQLTNIGMFIVAFLGLVTIWGTWFNLRQ